MAIRVIVTLAAGLVAWAVGYCLAQFAGTHTLCAAGRSPSSLGIVLGVASLLATWSHWHANVAGSRDEQLFRDQTK